MIFGCIATVGSHQFLFIFHLSVLLLQANVKEFEGVTIEIPDEEVETSWGQIVWCKGVVQRCSELLILILLDFKRVCTVSSVLNLVFQESQSQIILNHLWNLESERRPEKHYWLMEMLPAGQGRTGRASLPLSVFLNILPTFTVKWRKHGDFPFTN